MRDVWHVTFLEVLNQLLFNFAFDLEPLLIIGWWIVAVDKVAVYCLTT